jgi:uncharacterized cysteine cluster protein YcgN (CxxCxxCC family)
MLFSFVILQNYDTLKNEISILDNNDVPRLQFVPKQCTFIFNCAGKDLNNWASYSQLPIFSKSVTFHRALKQYRDFKINKKNDVQLTTVFLLLYFPDIKKPGAILI